MNHKSFTSQRLVVSLSNYAPPLFFYGGRRMYTGSIRVGKTEIPVYKMAGPERQYDPALTGLPGVYQYDGSRDGWKDTAKINVDAGVRHVAELVSAAVVKEVLNRE